MRAVIDELTLFCGCYDLGSVATPEHATPTSVVLRAVDKRAANVGTAQEVAIKAMMNEEQALREIMLRGDLNGEFVVQVNCSSADEDLKDKWSADLHKLGKWSNYRFGIVMVREGRSHSMRCNSVLTLTPPTPPPPSPPPSGTSRWSSSRSASTSS